MVSNILAEKPIATSGQAANKANRPTGTQPYGPSAPGGKRQTHFRARRRDEKENYSRCRKASSHGLRSKEQYSSSGPGKGCKPRKIMVRTTWGLSNCAVHEATVNLAEAYSLLKLLSFPPKHTLPPTLAGTWGTEEARLCTGGANREPHAQKSSTRWQSALLQHVRVVGMKGTPAESSGTARGTQGTKQSSVGTSRPPSQSPASHHIDAQGREKGKKIPMVRDLGASALPHFTLGNKRKADEPRQVRGEPKSFTRATAIHTAVPREKEDEHGAGGTGWRTNCLCGRNRIKPGRISEKR